MPKARTYTYAVSKDRCERSLDALLDMLRYDQGRVSEWDRDLIILQGSRPPTIGRWQSFAIPILALDEGEFCSASVRREALDKLPSRKQQR